MLAEYRSGHPDDVASAYERYRETLAEETGAEPDTLLRNFHFAIARGDTWAITEAESAIVKRTGTPLRSVAVQTPARPALAVPRQLPPGVNLVGRADLAAEVSWLLQQKTRPAAPVVVISGPGGIGKTALALRAAHESGNVTPMASCTWSCAAPAAARWTRALRSARSWRSSCAHSNDAVRRRTTGASCRIAWRTPASDNDDKSDARFRRRHLIGAQRTTQFEIGRVKWSLVSACPRKRTLGRW